jgi:hypothetical protein
LKNDSTHIVTENQLPNAPRWLIVKDYPEKSNALITCRAAEREAAFMVLGALCQSGLGKGGALEGSSNQLLGLIALALGEDARTELQIGW